MTIEDKLNKLIVEHNAYEKNKYECKMYHPNYMPHPEIEDWGWFGRLSNGQNHDDVIFVHIIHREIDEGDTSECLTSKSQYIRKCKKWLMKKNKEIE